MIPNLPSFYIILVLLIIYFLALLALIPGRHEMSLPHKVDCLAEIISFVYGSEVLEDAAFRAVRGKADMVTRLMALQVDGREMRFGFGGFRGRDGSIGWGIERLGRRRRGGGKV